MNTFAINPRPRDAHRARRLESALPAGPLATQTAEHMRLWKIARRAWPNLPRRSVRSIVTAIEKGEA